MNKLAKRNQVESKSEAQALPLKHVAIIMDGNRRWAKERKKTGATGHKEGVKSLKRLVKYVGEKSLDYLTVYAFSSENWQRKEEEVNYLLKLFSDVLKNEFAELAENRVRLNFIGDLEKMPARLKQSMQESMEKTRDNDGLSLQVAINYGSRQELANAAKRLAEDAKKGVIEPESIDEKLLSRYLYTADIPDPELLIRTGGEMRLSNYLLWQSAYTEFYVTQTLWPDFKPEDFDQAIEEFKRRHRRYGV